MATVSPRHLLLAATMAADQATAEVVGALQARGVPSLLLKGASMAALLYDIAGERTYADVDLLVPPPQRHVADEVLAELGFVSERAGLSEDQAARLVAEGRLAPHGVAWLRGGVEIDMHRSFPGIGDDDETTWSVLTDGGVPLGVGGATVRVPSPAARALIVVLHAAWHGRKAAGSLRELDRALQRLSDDTWREAADLAKTLDATPALAAGLMLVPRGAELAGRLGLSASATVAAALYARSLPPTALGFEHLATTKGTLAKVRLIAHEVFPDPMFLRQGSKLARRGPHGLVLAYLCRPFWLLAHSGRGYAEWRRARREATCTEG
jgi:hypothetical protein